MGTVGEPQFRPCWPLGRFSRNGSVAVVAVEPSRGSGLWITPLTEPTGEAAGDTYVKARLILLASMAIVAMVATAVMVVIVVVAIAAVTALGPRT